MKGKDFLTKYATLHPQTPYPANTEIENILQSFNPFPYADKEIITREGFKLYPSRFPPRRANTPFKKVNVKKPIPFRSADNQRIKCAKK